MEKTAEELTSKTELSMGMLKVGMEKTPKAAACGS